MGPAARTAAPSHRRAPPVDFGAFVPRITASWIAADPGARHQVVDGTLVSADLSGFTALSERLAVAGKQGAEELTATVNLCFTVLIAAAEAEGGDVLKFGGDALLLLFTGPDHTLRGVRGSVRMQRALRSPELRPAALRMSVGAHSGLFDLYLVGQPHRDLVVCGPGATAVTLLEAAAGPGEILVSAAAAADLDPLVLRPARDAGVPISIGRMPLPDVEAPARPTYDGPVAALLPEIVAGQLGALSRAGGEHRLATIAFLGLDGVDDRVSDLGPAAVADELDELVTELEATTGRYRLTFLYSDITAGGVKLIVTGGAPATTGSDEEAMLRAIQPLVRRTWPGRLRAGVHRGRVFAGFLGGPTRRTYTVMGDPVNLAARLLGRAGPGQLLASDDVVRWSRAVFDTTAVAPFLVKGKREPVHAHLVSDLRSGRSVTWVEDLPLVGREQELEQLRDSIANASVGHGRVVELRGEAGIGKTRLVRAVLDDPRLVVRLLVECQPYDRNTAYAAVRPLLRSIGSIDAAAAPDDAGASLTAWVHRVAPDLVPWLPLLSVPFGARVGDTPEASEVAAGFRARRTHEVVARLLAAALNTTSLLVIEDVYYIDDASLQLLRHVIRDIGERPWVLLATSRPVGFQLLADGTPGTLLDIGPLDASDCLELAAVAPSDVVLSDAEVKRLTERSGGNPLFVLELLNLVATPTGELPETIERLVASRIDQLLPTDRMLLRNAAVVGRIFQLPVLAAVLAGEEVDADDATVWVRMGEFIEPHGPGEFRFRHALYRDVAYEGMPFARRRELHSQVGEILEASAQEGDAVELSLLSTHFWLGARMDKAWRYSIAAGDDARRSHAVVEAIEFYERAVEAWRSLIDVPRTALSAVAEALGDVLELAARYLDAVGAYATARRSGPLMRHQQARLLRKQGVLSERQARYTVALRWYGRGMRLLGDHPEDPNEAGELTELELAYAGVRYRQGRRAACVDWAERAAGHARSAGDEPALAHANFLIYLATVADTPDAPEAYVRATEALRIYERLADPLGQAKVLNNLGVGAYFAGRWDEAVVYYERSLNLFLRAGDTNGAATIRNNIGEVRSDQGRYDEAEVLLTQATKSWCGSGYHWGCGVGTSNLGRLAVRRGKGAEGRAVLERVRADFDAQGVANCVLEADARLAEADVLAGLGRDAMARVRGARELAARAEADVATLVSLHRVAGWALLQGNDAEAAAGEFRQGLALAEGTGARYEAAVTMTGLAVAARLAGDPHADAFEAESERMLQQLGVVATPQIPLP